MKKLNVASLDVSGKIQTLEHIFDNMHSKGAGLGQAGYILGGDTGVGKTSFIRDLGQLLGMSLIIIETPHIVEEHIIDIPFIVVNPAGQSKSQHAAVDVKAGSGANQFDIKFAKSNLYTSLKAAQQTNDAGLIANIYRRPDLQLIWEKLGGTPTSIPVEIKDLRKRFDVLLFLDEYFRQASTTIRNMLRSILNGRIGSNDIPDNVYVIFASNLVDSGVGDILENEDFRLLNFDKPSTDEWFAYLLTKYSKSENVKLQPELMQAFYDLLNKHKGSLSMDDIAADVRVSPRRWEQLLLYINSSLPVKDQRDADMLLKNVEINFKNYQTGDKAEIAKDVIQTVKDLIKEQSKIEANEKGVEDSDWRETLKHQIEVKMKLGDDRKYIPVIGGLPGAGKTKYISELATDLNLVPVFVDVQNLSPEEVIGTPIAKNGAEDEIQVEFSRPPLWDQINEQIKKGESNMLARLTKFYGAEEAKVRLAKYEKQKVKYLIFFDELNRTNTKVFNAIRKVLLEKEFNDDYKLPAKSVVVAAINPTGKGTVELTKHVRDVFDVIPVGISWKKFSNHLDTIDLKVDKEAADISRSALNAFVEHFRSKGDKINGADPHFYLNLGGGAPLYISGREYTDLLVNLARTVQRAYREEMKHLGDPDHDAGQSELKIREAMARAFKHSLEYIISIKHGLDAPEFANDLEEWIKYTDKFSLGSLFKKKVESVKSLSSLLNKSFDKMDDDLFNDLEFVNYVTSVDPTVFKEELTEFLKDKMMADAANSFKLDSKRKELKGNKAKITDVEVTKIEFITREILHALKLHDISNKMIEMVKLSLRELLKALADHDDDLIMDIMKFNREITAYIKKTFA